MTTVPWSMALAVFIGTAPLLGVISWNLIKVDRLETKLEAMDTRLSAKIAELAGKVAELAERVAKIEGKIVE